MTAYLSSWASSILPASLGGQAASRPSARTGELEISALVVYPIKSCAGIAVEASSYGVTGLDYDRQWMLVDLHTQKMVTARTHPKAFLVKPRLNYDTQTLQIHIPSHGDFDVPFTPPADAVKLQDLQVWGSYDLQGHVVSPEGGELQLALSSIMETPVLLVHFDKTAPRLLGNQQFLVDLFEGIDDSLDYPLDECTTYFADGYPFLIATEASFEDIDDWLSKETTDTRMDVAELAKRYRPNILVKGNKEGFEEDSWEEIICGDTETIFPVSRCQRCPMPDVSPATGTLSVRRLPGTIVAKHRTNVDRLVKGACVGVNAISKKRSGQLSVGMKVKVVRRAQVNTEERLSGKYLRTEDRWS